MLTRADCIALSDLTEDEVEEIAEAVHIPDIVAAELGCYLIHSPDGTAHLRRIILDDLDEARRRGDDERVMRLRVLLHYFGRHHPDTVRPAPHACACKETAV